MADSIPGRAGWHRFALPGDTGRTCCIATAFLTDPGFSNVQTSGRLSHVTGKHVKSRLKAAIFWLKPSLSKLLYAKSNCLGQGKKDKALPYKRLNERRCRLPNQVWRHFFFQVNDVSRARQNTVMLQISDTSPFIAGLHAMLSGRVSNRTRLRRSRRTSAAPVLHLGVSKCVQGDVANECAPQRQDRKLQAPLPVIPLPINRRPDFRRPGSCAAWATWWCTACGFSCREKYTALHRTLPTRLHGSPTGSAFSCPDRC